MLRFAEQTWLHVAGAFVLMGGWATFVNSNHPIPTPLLAGLVQGVLSGIITFVLKNLLDGLRKRMNDGYGVWVPPFIASLMSFCLLLTMHRIADTPDVLKTISVPFAVASTYAVSYNFKMWKKEMMDD